MILCREDKNTLRELAKKVSYIAAMEIMDERRELWAAHNCFENVRTPIYIRDGWWSREVIEPQLECRDELASQVELYLRKMIFQYEMGDDFVIEKYIKIPAVHRLPGYGPWGVRPKVEFSTEHGGCNRILAALEDIADISMLKRPVHEIDEEATLSRREALQDAVGDIMPVLVERTPYWNRWNGDISTHLGYLLGTEGLMWAIYDNPGELKKLVEFMSNGIMKAYDEGEEAGDFSLLSHENQSMPYLKGLEGPDGGDKRVKRDKLWYFCAAQEFALISPEHHEEFLLEYQKPIIEKFAFSSYGCCEDLTRKIDMLRSIKNLRRIAVSPFADVEKCAEQIGGGYIASWRPDPAATVCLGFDPENVRGILEKAKSAFEANGCSYDICLKDVHTVQGDGKRLIDFVEIARQVAES